MQHQQQKRKGRRYEYLEYRLCLCLCLLWLCLGLSVRGDTESLKRSTPFLSQTLAWWSYPLDVIRRFHDNDKFILQPQILYEASVKHFFDRLHRNATERADTSPRVYVFFRPNALDALESEKLATAATRTTTTTTTPLVSFVSSLDYLFDKGYNTTLLNHNLFCSYWANCNHYLYILPRHPMAQKMFVFPLFFAHFGDLHDSVLYVDLDAYVQAASLRFVRPEQPSQVLGYDALLRAPGSNTEFLFQGGKWPNGGLLGMRNRPQAASFWSACIRRYMHSYWMQEENKWLLDQFAFHAELMHMASVDFIDKGCLSPTDMIFCDQTFFKFAVETLAANNTTRWLHNPCMFPEINPSAPLSSTVECEKVLETSVGRACQMKLSSSFFGKFVRCVPPIPMTTWTTEGISSSPLLQEMPLQFIHGGGYAQVLQAFALFHHTGSLFFSAALVEEENRKLDALRITRN